MCFFDLLGMTSLFAHYLLCHLLWRLWDARVLFQVKVVTHCVANNGLTQCDIRSSPLVGRSRVRGVVQTY